MPVIEEILTPNRVLAGVDARDWGHLVEQVGAVMVAAGDVEPSYVEAMKRVVREMGTYCVIAPGVVLLHARPETGVNRLCLALATVPAGVRFGSPNDPVFLAIGLGAVDHESHIELLAEIATILGDKGNVAALRNAGSVEEIMAVVRHTARLPE